MQVDILIKIREDIILHNYLKYNSYWYKELKRNPDSFSNLKAQMKETYKLTMVDKMETLNKKMNVLKEILDALI